MKRAVTFLACLSATLCTLAFAQAPAATGGVQAITSPVAYVYVSSSPDSGSHVINAYSVDSTGRLTAVIGSPFSADVQFMALTQHYLFGTNGTYIYSFTIASDGALQQASSINATQYNQYSSSGPINLFLDHTGATLYDGDINSYGTESNSYQSFSIDKSTGQLNFLANTADGGPNVDDLLSFTGANVFAYSSSCYKLFPEIYGYQRNSNQTLTQLNISPKIPAAPSGEFYCPYLAVSDPTTHVAVSLTPMKEFAVAGQPQLAVYTQASNGNLTTTSTSTNMPKTLVTQVNDIWMSPAGNFLAVAGTAGLQVFHFNGANPITHFTGLMTTHSIDQVFWDNANHLYALSRSTGKLYVFTVTTTSWSWAPGSPYTITSPQNLVVLPKT